MLSQRECRIRFGTLQTGNGEDVLEVQENVEQTGARVDSNNIIS